MIVRDFMNQIILLRESRFCYFDFQSYRYKELPLAEALDCMMVYCFAEKDVVFFVVKPVSS